MKRTFALLLVACAYLLTLGTIERRGFWTIDNALKFLQLRAILESGGRDYSISIPERRLDPHGELSPLPLPFAREAAGRVFPVFSPVFAVVSVLPYRFLGANGLFVLPLLASLLMLWGVGRITESEDVGRERDPAGREWRNTAPGLAILAAGLGTPVWFYSAVFWEHALAGALSVWGVWFHLRFCRDRAQRSLLRGAGLLAAAAYFREEHLLLSLVLLTWQAVRLRRQRRANPETGSADPSQLEGGPPAGRSSERWPDMTAPRALVAGLATTILVLTPLWVFQWIAVGQPLGFHLPTHLLRTSDIWEHLKQRPQVLYNSCLASHSNRGLSLIIGAEALLVFVLGAILRRGLTRRWHRRVMPLCAAGAAAGSLLSLAGYFGAAGPILALDRSNAFFASAPLLALGFIQRRRETTDRAQPPAIDPVPPTSGIRMVLDVAWIYMAAYLLVAPELGSRGIHWGNRFFYVLYPLLAVPAACNLCDWWADERGRFGRRMRANGAFLLGGSAIALALGVSVAAQLYSITLLDRMNRFTYRFNQTIRSRAEDVIMTELFWVPALLTDEFFERQIFLVRTQAQYERFLQLLRNAGKKEFLLLTQMPAGPGQPADLEVSDQGLRFFALRGYARQVEIPPVQPDQE